MRVPTDTSLPPLAIVGLSLKFPQDAVSPQSFWKMIVEGRCASTDFPSDRLNIDAHYHPDQNRLDTLSVKGGHFMKEDVSLFDAPFFSITAAEAEAMDPQQRLVLETAYRALENAGIPMENVARSKTCVFTGSFGHDYQSLQVKDPLLLPKWNATGTSMNMQSNRVSWFFDLVGPSSTVDTACSSSLMAVDLACQSIWSGDSTMGLAIGSNAILALETGLSLNNLGLLSTDSRCYSFDRRGNGYARGEGVGVLVIRPLEDAMRNGDTIRAVIRSSSSNQDGKTPGITQPSSDMQRQLIRDTYRKGGLDLASTRYFEAHGTGMLLLPSFKAIGSIFRNHRSPDDPGSVKSTIGHLEGASGIAGIIKAVLALERGVIPPNSTNYENLNPRIDDEFWNIKIPNKAISWPTDGLRRASVSSFGFGGSNSHIVLDDAYHFLHLRGLRGNHNTVKRPPSVKCNGVVSIENAQEANSLTQHSPKVLVWSSADEQGIARLQDAWRPFLSTIEEDRQQYLNDLAYTLNRRRSHMPWRTFVVAQPDDDWTKLADGFSSTTRSIASPNMAMIFSGQGAQWFAMGRELLHVYPVFMQSVEEAGIYLKTMGCRWNALDELLKPASESNVNQTEYSQTLCTVVQVALVDLLRSWDIAPKAVVGHSSGEIAAAYCTRAISRTSAWKIAYHRGKLSGKLEKFSRTKGSMLAVALSEQDVLSYLDDLSDEVDILRLTVACINSPKSLTISGEEDQIDLLRERLDKEGVFARKLKVSVAYHSFQMHEIAGHYQRAIGSLDRDSSDANDPPEMVSSVTGTWAAPDELRRASYWVRNMVSPVLFSQAVSKLFSETTSDPIKKLDRSHRRKLPIHHLVEVGPHSVLQGPCKDILKTIKKDKTAYLSMLVRNVSAVDTALSVVGNLYAAGYPVNLSRVNNDGELTDQTMPKALPDLPEYPFNHTKSYWHESHISKNHRLRKIGRVDLLGVRDDNWNPLEPRWRNIIRVSEMPWVQDHKINDTILYPGAGMLAMAIEGANQMTNGKKIAGFNLKDTTFHAAIRVPATKGIETGLYMRPIKGMETKSSTWFDFRVCTYENDTWTENCTGSIQIVYSPEGEQNDDEMAAELLEYQADCYSETKNVCHTPIDAGSLYKFLSSCGYGYGDAFQLIKTLNFNSHHPMQVVGEVTSYSSPAGEVIHPSTLDAIMQTSIWTLSKSGTETIPTMIPTHIDKLWISNEGLKDISSLRVHSSTMQGQSDASADITAFDDELQQSLVSLKGLKMSTVSANEVEEMQTSKDNLCHHLEWKPDITLLNNDEITSLCHQEYPLTATPDNTYTEADFLLNARIVETLDRLSQTEYQLPHPHYKKYIDWMVYRKQLLDQGKVQFSFEPWKSRLQDKAFIQTIENKVMNFNKQGNVVASVAQNLFKFLTGEMDVLHFLFEGSLMKDFYFEWLHESHGLKRFAKYLDLMAHHNPSMKIIEVGAGTGSMTDMLLRTLGRGEDISSHRRYAKWDFTDISRSFFADAQDEFSEEGDRMKFNTLNIEQDPEGQGFQCGSYDVVVASMVFHATSDLKATLSHARKLLKPGGKLVLYELTMPEVIRTAFVFGLLEGWWLSSEPYRQLGPCVDQDKWHELLQETGFSGLDVSLADYEDPTRHEQSLLVSTAVEDISEPSQPEIEIVFDPYESGQEEVAESLAEECQVKMNAAVKCSSIQEAAAANSQDILLRVFLIELQTPSLADMQPELYAQLQTLLKSTTVRTLWVNQGGGHLSPRPHFGLVEGLFRVLMEEDDRRRCYLLSLEESTSQHRQIVKVMQSLLAEPGVDTEYIEQKGILHIGRLSPSKTINDAVSLRTTPQQKKIQDFGCDVALKFDTSSPALLNGLQFIEDETASRPLDADEVEVEIKCAGLNFRDVLIAVGQLKSIHSGFECAGIVSRVGSSCQRLRVGDSVAVLASGCFANVIRVRETGAVVKIDRSVSFAAAAAVPVNFATAHIALNDVARMKTGESVLIHSGSGGTGQAAIQIAQSLGVKVFTTVGSQSKKQFLMDTYNIPASHIFSSRSTLFAKAIKHRTGGKGVDVILNSLAGESLLASWECIAPYGRFIELGMRDILSNRKLPMLQFLRNVTFSVVDLSSLLVDRPAVCSAALESVYSGIAQGKLQPPQPVSVYGVGEMEKAFRSMQSGKHVGKMVIEMRKDDQVMTVLNTKPRLSLDPNATFVIAGGFGGIGKNIARWLADNGARHLVLLSRSGGQGTKAQTLINELHARHVQVMTPFCDISDEASLRKALAECHSMPPIKGCIQAAMVIRDTPFENISYQYWQECVAPKVQGSWNLHQQLPSGMDFFIMLSSISGIIGMKAQANYAAANTFQDHLARHRIGLGEKATALNLGVIGFTGAVAENAKLQERLVVNLGFDAVIEQDFHALMDYYCSPQVPGYTATNCQTTIGLFPSATRKPAGERTWIKRPFFRQLLLGDGAGGNANGSVDQANIAVQLQQAQSQSEANEAVMEALTARLSKALSIAVTEIDANKPLHQYGVDSLVAVELRSWFVKELQADIAVFDILGSATVTSVGQLATRKSKLRTWN
ncbi:hypothetical protein ASPWEDRAFT_106140 [Aspergillus wentii DTO 134E9]|uniref:Uncharacterized protein n=1 Tax=Aspergillus wentii DTO 134E9 TaxID=1073089 RepID=A0A1L9RT18_ASPWE|nr:uncharacterized protein ASPWEDRAFT_106140 [Aspergillus wentii DTO 134E9]OJJ38044.1 hypothetical protein ASPWEDRAFT_106140 [Aspergillus wentii DTO 134E9]